MKPIPQILLKETSTLLDAQEWINEQCRKLPNIAITSCKPYVDGQGFTNYVITIIYKIYE